MPYKYFDGKTVDKTLLKPESSLFVVAEPLSIYYGDTVVFGYDDQDGSPWVTIQQPGKEPVKKYYDYASLVYLGERGEN